jgi:hypothetical protein
MLAGPNFTKDKGVVPKTIGLLVDRNQAESALVEPSSTKTKRPELTLELLFASFDLFQFPLLARYMPLSLELF